MRKIRIFEHISLDGVIERRGPNEDSDFANGGWTAPYRTPAGAQALAEAQGKGFDLLLGRRTYDLWAVTVVRALRSRGGPVIEITSAHPFAPHRDNRAR